MDGYSFFPAVSSASFVLAWSAYHLVLPSCRLQQWYARRGFGQPHPEAAAEYVAFQWCAERSANIAAAFAEEISGGLRPVRQAPERWSRYSARYRRLLIRRFPYY